MKISKTKIMTASASKIIALGFTTLLWIFSHSANAEITAYIDRTDFGLDETVTLTLTYNSALTTGNPDLRPLGQDFEVTSQSQSHSYQSINGRGVSTTTWTLVLRARRQGELYIPPIIFNGTATKAIPVTVRAPKPLPAGQKAPVFLETIIDKEQAHVQEQILYTVRLATRVRISNFEPEPLKLNNAKIESLGDIKQYERDIDGVRHIIAELSYAIYPQKSGTLEIPEYTYDMVVQQPARASYRDPYGMRNSQQIQLKTDAKTIEVKAAEVPGHWLPSPEVTLSQSFSSNPNNFIVGEPITRSVTLRAKDLTGSQLPKIEFGIAPGLSIYPDKEQLDDRVSSQGFIAMKNQSAAIVASKPGSYTLPEIAVSWYNTKTGQMETATLASMDIQVQPGAGMPSINLASPILEVDQGQAAANLTEDTQGDSTVSTNSAPTWLWSFCGLLMILLLGQGLWIARLQQRLNQQVGSSSDANADHLEKTEKQIWQDLQRTAQANNPHAFNKAIDALAQARFGQSHNPRVELLESSTSTLLKELSQKLERSLYGQSKGQQVIDLRVVLNELDKVRHLTTGNPKLNSGPNLQPLYQS